MDRRTEASAIDALYRISSLAGKTDDPGEALESILAEIVKTFDADSGSIALINPDSGRLEIEVSHGLPTASSKVRLRPGEGVTGWVALHGKPLVIPDVRSDPRYFQVRKGVQSEMAAPMEDRGQVIGVVNIDSDTPDTFNENDLKLLVLITAEAATVARGLWLIQQLKTKAAQLESMLTIGRRLVSKLELQEIIDGITLESRRIIDCPVCAIFLISTDGERLELYSVNGGSGAFARLPPLAIDENSIGVAISRKKQVEVLDLVKTEESFPVLDAIQSEGLVSLLASPIVYEGEVIGVLNAYTSHQHRFNNEEKGLVAAMASLGAVAIQNARLYARVFESEEKLRVGERLNTLGLLASEVAHEIRNPLTVIKLLFQSLDLSFPGDDPRARDVSVIEEKLNHLEAIVGRILNFAKSSEELHSRCTLQSILNDTLILVRLKLEQSRIHLVYDEPADPIEIEGNPGQLQQVLLNLIFNAIQSMPAGGDLRLEMKKISTSESAAWAELIITDTGCGIPRNIRERIFDSFLSGRQEGTGLGMAIVKRILDGHHGNIAVVRSDSEGTSIRLALPLADAGDPGSPVEFR